MKTVLERWGRLEEELEQIDFKLTKREIANSLINICSVSTGVGYFSYKIIHRMQILTTSTTDQKISSESISQRDWSYCLDPLQVVSAL